jgi:transcriptional regulator with XRE-family HTH domain
VASPARGRICLSDRAIAFEGFGPRLREVRVRAGLSQGQLHVRSGVPKSRLSRYENGHLMPSLHTLRRIVNALGITEATLLVPREANVDAFCEVLKERGVRFETEEQARTLAHRVAGVVLERSSKPAR